MATKEVINAFLQSNFPHNQLHVEAVGNRSARVVFQVMQMALRPGGTVAGPALVGVADAALYVAILGEIGIVPLAYTTSLTANFLRRPPADQRIIAECKLMKLGKSLAVGDVWLYSEGDPEPVAHVVGTYSIPPTAQRQQPASAKVS